ncbi:metal-dependent hydrolase [Methylomonas sp. EFPC3]|uniref:metal-dependent hydrolase n=1 Tax=Methylomonas sp. EFPC3 TaxID=3021710 RepID=UPI0024169CF5|nr:metal-dependent hydrolase [Methylomonas sp. EFPC3]WFP51905.1 metal-dependent hydrolase [Methylomonas sp. EFPC3]
MLIAHLPAGYIVSVLTYPLARGQQVDCKTYLRCGMLGAVAPDFDMIYFYLVDGGMHPHHSYFSHFPLTWLLLVAAAAVYYRRSADRRLPILALVFAGNGFLHMLLDYIASNIYWLAPFVLKPYSLSLVDRVYQPWWLNFLLHRSFAVEIAITATAWMIRRRRGLAANPELPAKVLSNALRKPVDYPPNYRSLESRGWRTLLLAGNDERTTWYKAIGVSGGKNRKPPVAQPARRWLERAASEWMMCCRRLGQEFPKQNLRRILCWKSS